jgi:hypothetical protein
MEISPTTQQRIARVTTAIARQKYAPTGKNQRCVLPFAKFTANSFNDSVSNVVMLDVKKGATSNAWEHNLTRTYGPFGENGTGFCRAGDFSAGATQVRLTFVDSIATSAFVASLANLGDPPEANTGERKEIVNNHLPFEGKSFVFTGDSSNREKLERRVTDLGGKVRRPAHVNISMYFNCFFGVSRAYHCDKHRAYISTSIGRHGETGGQ